MKKIRQVRGKLAKSTVILLALLAACLAFYLLLSTYAKSLEDEITENDDQKIGLVSKGNAIKKRVALSKEAVKFYEDFKAKNGESDQLFRRDTLKTVMVSVRQDMLLSSTQLTPEAFENIKGGEYEKERAIAIQANITLEYDAPSDVVAIKVIRDLQNKLPGYIDVISFEMKKNREFAPQDIIDISTGKPPSIVKCKLVFKWMGVKDKEFSETDKNSKSVQLIMKAPDA